MIYIYNRQIQKQIIIIDQLYERILLYPLVYAINRNYQNPMYNNIRHDAQYVQGGDQSSREGDEEEAQLTDKSP